VTVLSLFIAGNPENDEDRNGAVISSQTIVQQILRRGFSRTQEPGTSNALASADTLQPSAAKRANNVLQFAKFNP
jgi:hypothetical protein